MQKAVMKPTYNTINTLRWDEILRHDGRAWQAPLTVHMPLHPAHSPDWMMVDAALNVSRFRVLPDQSTGMSAEAVASRQNLESVMVQFALDDPPFVPDFRCTGIDLEGGRLPIVQAWYFAADIKYAFTYYCRPLDDRQSLLWIRVTVENADEIPRKVCVRPKVCLLPEKSVFNHHYAPFFWDAGKVLSCPGIALEGEAISYKGRPLARVLNSGFNLAWEEAESFKDEDYNRFFNCNRPYFAAPSMRLKEVRQTVRLAAELSPGESRSFAIAVLTDYAQASAAHIETLAAADPEADKQRCIAHFTRGEPGAVATLESAAGQWQDIFFRMQTMIDQMLVRFPGKTGLVPYQGGTTERHFVWVWEAVIMLQPLLRIGRFSEVRQALDTIFSLQDAGFPPKGEFATTAGAIGTTGPRWACTTGAALALASDYLRYSGDDAFRSAFLPRMLKAADWIVGEIRAERKCNPDGSRPPWYGLMPFCCATDGDVGRIVAKTDGFSFWGLDKFARLLEAVRHARGAEFASEVAMYRKDIEAAVKTMTREDGFIERKILTGKETKIARKFEHITGAQQLFYTGALDVDFPGLPAFVHYWETKFADGPFLGAMDAEKVYIGNSECYWQHLYLRLGEWKKAFLAFQTFLKYGLTENTFLVQERFSRLNAAFTPWQPNGSGSGRVLEMMLNAFYFESDGEVVLFGGVPFAWLADNGRTALEGLYTPGGRIRLEATMLDAGQCRIALSADSPGAMPVRIRIPDFLRVVSSTNGRRLENGVFAVPEGSLETEFIVQSKSY